MNTMDEVKVFIEEKRRLLHAAITDATVEEKALWLLMEDCTPLTYDCELSKDMADSSKDDLIDRVWELIHGTSRLSCCHTSNHDMIHRQFEERVKKEYPL